LNETNDEDLVPDFVTSSKRATKQMEAGLQANTEETLLIHASHFSRATAELPFNSQILNENHIIFYFFFHYHFQTLAGAELSQKL
jgi:hypothetical protein